MLKIINYTKKYGSKTAVDDLTLEVERGAIYGFIGHNGAGKTTTIKAITGILQIERGDIFIGGKSIKSEPIACKRKMAYIPDSPDLYEFMTGIKYINFICDIYGVSAEKRDKDIKKYAEGFEMINDLGSPISSYSHGMKQKTAIIAALAHRPELIVMDEPFVGLDPKASFLLKEYMRDICAAGGAIFFSTHILEVAEKLCDKIAVISAGKLVCSGTMSEVKGDSSLEEFFIGLTEEKTDE